MIIQIEIPDDAIKQEDKVNNTNIIALIDFGIHYIFRVALYNRISDSDIKISIK